MSTIYESEAASSAEMYFYSCDQFEMVVAAMDDWQRQNMVYVFENLHPVAKYRGKNFEDHLRDIDMELFHKAYGVSYTEVPISPPTEGLILDPNGRPSMRSYRAYQRPELWDYDMHLSDKKRPKPKRYLADLGKYTKMPLQAKKGLELEAYCRLFWVIGFQWRPETKVDEDKELSIRALNIMGGGPVALGE